MVPPGVEVQVTRGQTICAWWRFARCTPMGFNERSIRILQPGLTMLSRRAKALFHFLAGPLMLCNATTYRLIRAPRKGYVRAHLGPGQQNYTEGSINVDANMFTAECDVWADLPNKLPFHDVDRNLKGLTWWTNKHNKFTIRQMLDFLNLEYGFFPADRSLDKCSSAQTRLKRFLRNQIFARAPLWVRGLLYFSSCAISCVSAFSMGPRASYSISCKGCATGF